MLKRFSVSLEQGLLDGFDDYIQQRGYSNRSEAVRDLIRKALVTEEWESDLEVVGVVTLVYNHHHPHLQEKITEMQHDFYQLITSTTHVHMDSHNCLEVTIVKGKSSQVRELAESLIALRGDGGWWKGELSSSALSTAVAVSALSVFDAEARVAGLYGRKINNSEHQLSFVRYLRAVADDHRAAGVVEHARAVGDVFQPQEAGDGHRSVGDVDHARPGGVVGGQHYYAASVGHQNRRARVLVVGVELLDGDQVWR